MPRYTWLVALLALAAGCAGPQVAKLAVVGDHRELRPRADGAKPSSPGRPSILYLALDGVGRDTLYEPLRAGRLPSFERLLGGKGLAHAYLDGRMLSTLPSSTMAAWMTTLTGVGPATHGVTGNEFFIREEKRFACPAPVSFSSAGPTLAIYTEDYLDELGSAPTAYEQMRKNDPDLLVWVAMHNVYRGADRLLLAKKTVIARAFEGFVEVEARKHLEDKESRRLYADLDGAVIDKLVTDLEDGPVPDVLTVYFSGADLYAHVAEEGPDGARRHYLEEVADPLVGKLVDALEKRHALEKRWVVVGADHGHTGIIHDDAHALATKHGEDPPSVLETLGFRVRPFEEKVSDKEPFSAVLAYGGAMAYVYLADRSKCPEKDNVCDWTAPPRYQEDVLAVAEAFYKNDRDGSVVPAMKGTLDMILVRRPKPWKEIDDPFEVYVGDGKSVPVDAWLKEHPHPTYVDVAPRLRDLAVGVHGERAGDLLLLAHNGDRDRPEDRYYFAAPYHSWHGSPSKRDSELPFIVSHRGEPASAIGPWIEGILADRPYQQKTTDVLVRLRAGSFGK